MALGQLPHFRPRDLSPALAAFPAFCLMHKVASRPAGPQTRRPRCARSESSCPLGMGIQKARYRLPSLDHEKLELWLFRENVVSCSS